MEIDSFMKAKVRSLSLFKCRLEPSCRFTQETMERIKRAESNRKKVLDRLIIALALTPFFVREVWYVLKNQSGFFDWQSFMNSITGFRGLLIFDLLALALLVIGGLFSACYLKGWRLPRLASFSYFRRGILR